MSRPAKHNVYIFIYLYKSVKKNGVARGGEGGEGGGGYNWCGVGLGNGHSQSLAIMIFLTFHQHNDAPNFNGFPAHISIHGIVIQHI